MKTFFYSLGLVVALAACSREEPVPEEQAASASMSRQASRRNAAEPVPEAMAAPDGPSVACSAGSDGALPCVDENSSYRPNGSVDPSRLEMARAARDQRPIQPCSALQGAAFEKCMRAALERASADQRAR